VVTIDSIDTVENFLYTFILSFILFKIPQTIYFWSDTFAGLVERSMFAKFYNHR